VDPTLPPREKPPMSKNSYWERRSRGGKTCRHAAVAPFHYLAITTTHIIILCKLG